MRDGPVFPVVRRATTNKRNCDILLYGHVRCSGADAGGASFGKFIKTGAETHASNPFVESSFYVNRRMSGVQLVRFC